MQAPGDPEAFYRLQPSLGLHQHSEFSMNQQRVALLEKPEENAADILGTTSAVVTEEEQNNPS